MSEHATAVHGITKLATQGHQTQAELCATLIAHCEEMRATFAADVAADVAALPVLWAGHNSDVADIPDIYQVMTSSGYDFANTLQHLGVIGTIDTLWVLQSIDFGDASFGANGARPESFRLAHAVRDLTGYDMGADAHTAIFDAQATRRLLLLRLVRDHVFPWSSRVARDFVSKAVSLRQVVGRIRWLRYVRGLGH
jgi:hypothetical protein